MPKKQCVSCGAPNKYRKLTIKQYYHQFGNYCPRCSHGYTKKASKPSVERKAITQRLRRYALDAEIAQEKGVDPSLSFRRAGTIQPLS